MSSKFEVSRRGTIFPGSDGLHQTEHHTESVPPKRNATVVKSNNESGLLNLYLPTKHKSRMNNNKKSSWTEGSPWSSYEKAYRLELGGSVAVVYKRETGDQFILSSISATHDQIRLLCRLDHRNLVCTYEVFRFEDAFYTISEHLAVSLVQFIGCDKPVSEAQLASVSGQCLDGVSYLASQGLRHPHLTCSNILLSFDGVVKIANLDHCQSSKGASSKQDVTALGQVIMSVMNKSLQGTEKYGVQDPDRWSQDAMDFVSMTVDATHEELISHPFLSLAKAESLPWLVAYALRQARIIVGSD